MGFELGFADFHIMIFRHEQPRLRLLYPSEVAPGYLKVTDLTVIPISGWLNNWEGLEDLHTFFLSKSQLELADESSFFRNVLCSP